jgi:hypothetical protein
MVSPFDRWDARHGGHRRVATDAIEATEDVGPVFISTVLLWEGYSDQVPVAVYETRIFGGPLDNRMRQTGDREIALKNHRDAVNGELDRTGSGVNFLAEFPVRG